MDNQKKAKWLVLLFVNSRNKFLGFSYFSMQIILD